jgi:hypothetical protein
MHVVLIFSPSVGFITLTCSTSLFNRQLFGTWLILLPRGVQNLYHQRRRDFGSGFAQFFALARVIPSKARSCQALNYFIELMSIFAISLV